MNAKTTKFLAVLAVMAMAFAAVAIFAPAENDAAETKSVWTASPAEGASYITLGTDVTKPVDGGILDDATAYYVDADMTLYINKDANITDGATLIFLKENVTVTVIIPEGAPNELAYALWGVVESVDEQGNTVLTLHDNYAAYLTQDTWVKADKTINYAKTWQNAVGNGATAHNPADHGTEEVVISYYEGMNLDGTEKLMWSTEIGTAINAVGDYNVFGTFVSIGLCDTNPATATMDVEWQFLEATGVVESYHPYDATATTYVPLPSANTASLDNFTGIINVKKTGTAADEIPVIERWDSGNITVTKGSIKLGENVNIPAGSKITYAQGATILSGQIFSFQGVMDDDSAKTATDVYKFKNTYAVTAGDGGFVISTGVNGFELSGKILAAKNNVHWEFEGAAYFTGSIDAIGYGVEITPGRTNDFTFGSATIYSDGLTLDRTVAVKSGAVLTVNKNLTLNTSEYFPATLKVGEEAYVRVYGDMTVGANALNAKIYTAGNIVADVVKAYVSTGTNAAISPVDAETDLSGIVYVYKDGSLTGSNVSFTKVDEARMAYVDLTGRGNLGVNGVTVINNTHDAAANYSTGYYKYSAMVFFPVATQDVLNLAAESRIVGGINAIADISESDVNIALWYAKYKINYDTATPLFVIEYKETYEVIVNGAGTDYTITDSNGTQVYTYVDGENTKAKLIFGETYSLNGMVNTSKYTYTSTINTADAVVQPMNFVDNLHTTFTMVRAAIVQEIIVEVGEEQTITVTLVQPDNDQVFAAGDKILDYSTDGGETMTAVELKLKNNSLIGTFKVFNTDKVLVKFVDQKYFKNAVTAVVENTDFIKDITAAEITQKAAIKAKGYTFAFQGVADKTTGTFKVTYSLNEKNDLYKLVDENNLVGNLLLTITFQDYYKGNSGHNQSYSFKPGTTAASIPNNVKTFVGETYTMTWTDLSEVRETMTYKEGNKDKTYVEGSIVSIGSGEASTTYTLTLTKIYYASVQNKVTKDFTVSDGMGNTTPVAVDMTAPKAVEITKKHVTQTGQTSAEYDEYTVTLTLEVTGAYIRSWSYAIYADSTSTTPLYEGGTYSLPTADLYYKDQDITGKVIRITNLEVIPILYLVKTQPDEHAKIAGDYSRAGYYGDKMFVYVNVEAGFSVTGVEVFYEDPEHEGFPGDKYTDAQKDSSPDQGDFWWYMMPASNVVLIPTTTSDYATVTFKNYDGTVLQGPTKVLKGTTPEYTGDIPTKPATETETYRFAGWEPVLAPVTEDTTYVAQFETVAPTSTDVTIFLEKAENGVKVTLLANDGRFLQEGSIEFTYYYAYELNGKWATGFKTCTAQTGEIDDKSLFQFTVDLSEQERFAETMWIEGTYTSADEAVNAASELIVYQ